MALLNAKILETERNAVYVKSVPGERLTGNVQQNKDVFDKFPQLIMGKYNDLVDLLISLNLDNITTDLSDRYTKTEADAKITEETSSLVTNVTINTDTGVITVTKKDGTSQSVDTALEKVPATFEFVEDIENDKYYLKITNVDGSTSQTEVTNLMNQFTFTSGDIVTFSQSTNGTTTTITASIKAGSVGFNELKGEVKAYIDNKAADTSADKEIVLAAKTEVLNASQSVTANTTIVLNAKDDATAQANKAKSYAVGGTGTREGEDTDNAQYYSNQANLRANDAHNSAIAAELAKDQAQEIVGGDFLTKTGDGSDVTATFTETASRTNIVTGEKLSVLFGKIKKFFTDLKTVAFTGSYTDLSNKPKIPEKNKVLTGSLTVAGWTSETGGFKQTLTVPGLATTGYTYTVYPNSAQYKVWTEAGIYADDVTTANSITFHCTEKPTVAVSVNIKKEQVG